MAWRVAGLLQNLCGVQRHPNPGRAPRHRFFFGSPATRKRKKVTCTSPGVWRRVRACAGGPSSTNPGRDNPRLCRRSNRPAGVLFFGRTTHDKEVRPGVAFIPTKGPSRQQPLPSSPSLSLPLGSAVGSARLRCRSDGSAFRACRTFRAQGPPPQRGARDACVASVSARGDAPLDDGGQSAVAAAAPPRRASRS